MQLTPSAQGAGGEQGSLGQSAGGEPSAHAHEFPQHTLREFRNARSDSLTSLKSALPEQESVVSALPLPYRNSKYSEPTSRLAPHSAELLAVETFTRVGFAQPLKDCLTAIW
jgi:hypothetical protein